MSTDDNRSIRELLGGRAEPSFELNLPPGWRRWDINENARQTWLKAARQRFAHLHRPDLNAFANRMVNEAFENFSKSGAIAMYVPTDDDENTLWLPTSIVVAPVKASGNNLDGHVRALINEYGGSPLFGDQRFVRTERETRVQLDGAEMINTTVEYLTPVPGSRRKKALNFVASLPREATIAADHDYVLGVKTLFDSVVSTLRWVAPSEPEEATS